MSAALGAVRPFARCSGRARTERGVHDDLSSDAVVAGVCLEPSRWPERGARWSRSICRSWPAASRSGELVGREFRDGPGQPRTRPVGAGPHARQAWPAGAFARRPGAGGPRRRHSRLGAAVVPGPRGPHLHRRLRLLGLLASQPNTLRYDLLLIFVPVGALLAGLGAPAPAVRAALVTATLVWVTSSLGDYRALAAEVRSGRWPDSAGTGHPDARGASPHALWGEYRLAYLLSFRSQERVTVAPNDSHRIDEYATRGRGRARAVHRRRGLRPGRGTGAGIWLCPTPDASDGPVY